MKYSAKIATHLNWIFGQANLCYLSKTIKPHANAHIYLYAHEIILQCPNIAICVCDSNALVEWLVIVAPLLNTNVIPRKIKTLRHYHQYNWYQVPLINDDYTPFQFSFYQTFGIKSKHCIFVTIIKMEF